MENNTYIQLSIIIPHFNSSELVEKLLATIPQDKNIQTVIVDDKSEKEHLDHLIKLQDTYKFELYYNDRVKSAGTCRNIGLEKAIGKWVLFADSDDFFTENFYEKVAAYFLTDNEVVFFKPTSIYVETGEISDRHITMSDIIDNYANKNKNGDLSIRYKLHSPISKIIRRDFVTKYNLRFDEVIAANDTMFSVKIGHVMETFDTSQEIIYVITRNHSSLTVNSSEAVFDSRLYTTIRYRDFLKEHLSTEDFAHFTFDRIFRSYLIRSRQYGIIKTFKLIILFKNKNLKYFDFKFLNPLYLLRMTYRHNKMKKNKNPAHSEQFL